jgi:hypothetical protein
MDDRERIEEVQVKDRRRFTAEGEAKPDLDGASSQSDAESAEEATEKGTSRDGAVRESDQERSQQKNLPPIDFSGLILSLANTALFQLGLVTTPGGEPKKDLPAARQTIDIIALLEAKTKGNLTDQEKKILSETLFQLRMAFVESSK